MAASRPTKEAAPAAAGQAGDRAAGDGAVLPARERILRTSAELFARNGYHATGMAELSTATRLSRGSLYHHMDGKESILYEICRVQIDDMNAQAAEIVGRGLPPAETLRVLGRALLRNISDHLNEWSVFFKEFQALSGDRRTEIVAARDQFEQYWLRTVRAVVPEGSGVDVSPVLVKGILGMFNYAYLWFRPGGPLSPEQTADLFVDVLVKGLHPVE
ncbi:TetR/AcrR family transcriptional regulator [Phytohabitans sp. ZYX-F-186]|uniref:TetR/AcrR family transcriptional regulator n=1 Tax=Phytohabitans maris TaxID=3071409 RepID=A0ABU0ZN01_9ACTN|nr:TetR/AcrR family transcriptional regulator [Phytohabitans sp. ZYX-F-186]MDQ7908031.1 TetR/AcrR family transcriptional regulator [Phytohabitans sp. ZYX-F-186]